MSIGGSVVNAKITSSFIFYNVIFRSVIAIVNEFFFFGISMLLDDAIILIKRVSEK